MFLKGWYSLDVQNVQNVQTCVQTVQSVQRVPSNLLMSTLLYRRQGIVDERFERFERFERIRRTNLKDQTGLIF